MFCIIKLLFFFVAVVMALKNFNDVPCLLENLVGAPNVAAEFYPRIVLGLAKKFSLHDYESVDDKTCGEATH
jgi:hypothetical protein